MRKYLLVICIGVLCALSLVACARNNAPDQQTESQTTATEHSVQQDLIGTEQPEEPGMMLGYGMEVTDVGPYTGTYMEDGTDELVSGVLMCVITNTGDQTIQYAHFNLQCGEELAEFEISTLYPGERLVALEQNRLAHRNDGQYSALPADTVSVFREEPSLCEDRISVQMLDGIVNVKNISQEDISEDVVIYYKNAAEDILYGGITYRVRITGGIPAGQIRQMTAGHMRSNGTRIMFVTVG